MNKENYRHALKCKACGTIIMSLHRHDFVVCECWNPEENKGIFIDGGNAYIRAGGQLGDMEDVKIKVK